MRAENLAELFRRYAEIDSYLRTDDEAPPNPPAHAEAQDLIRAAYAAEELRQEQRPRQNAPPRRQSGGGVAETDSESERSGHSPDTAKGKANPSDHADRRGKMGMHIPSTQYLTLGWSPRTSTHHQKRIIPMDSARRPGSLCESLSGKS